MLLLRVRFTYPGDAKVQVRTQQVSGFPMACNWIATQLPQITQSPDKLDFLEITVREHTPVRVKRAESGLERGLW